MFEYIRNSAQRGENKRQPPSCKYTIIILYLHRNAVVTDHLQRVNVINQFGDNVFLIRMVILLLLMT
ncbi:hypothetical protein F7725_020635 [Dissostichus mawsoni]|uniref:Uncharacterized protein n=1 Tax=Dissostichus mawsoni TaxID=36200 RepID=A0A7J5YGG7_DISMA|nr:hypothetical protein F7725_020635 [Dissostichus mawsoni]